MIWREINPGLWQNPLSDRKEFSEMTCCRVVIEISGDFITGCTINRAKHSVEKWKKSLIVIEYLAKYFWESQWRRSLIAFLWAWFTDVGSKEGPDHQGIDWRLRHKSFKYSVIWVVPRNVGSRWVRGCSINEQSQSLRKLCLEYGPAVDFKRLFKCRCLTKEATVQFKTKKHFYFLQWNHCICSLSHGLKWLLTCKCSACTRDANAGLSEQHDLLIWDNVMRGAVRRHTWSMWHWPHIMNLSVNANGQALALIVAQVLSLHWMKWKGCILHVLMLWSIQGTDETNKTEQKKISKVQKQSEENLVNIYTHNKNQPNFLTVV